MSSWIEVQPSRPLTWKALRWTGENLEEVREVLGGSAKQEFGMLPGLANGTAQPGEWIVVPPLGMQPFRVRHDPFQAEWDRDVWSAEEWELARRVIHQDRAKEASAREFSEH